MASPGSVETWDDAADVIVVGYGVAGAATAIAASDAGADVLILEKMPERYAGGNSRAGDQLALPTDVDAIADYQRAMNEPHAIPEPVLRAWAEGMAELAETLPRMAEEVGFEFRPEARWPEFPDMPGAACITVGGTIHPAPSGVWHTFRLHVERRPIRVACESPVVDLVQDPDTLELHGVVTERDGRRLAIRARRAVVLCCGGYEANLAMQHDYFGLDRVVTLGTAGNTGDGVRMLQKAGADLWHLRPPNQTGGFWPSIVVPEFEAGFFRALQPKYTSWIDVARDDRRFYNETQESFMWSHWKERVHGAFRDAPNAFVTPVHTIFDDVARRTEPIIAEKIIIPEGWNLLVEGYEWSRDNSAEVAKGWITRADSIRELAGLVGRDPDMLEATVREFNEAARGGHDEAFGRDAATMTPIEEPPFYAVESVPGIVVTTGGGRRDERSRVLGHDGAPIPRLYEAGELGCTFANLYQYGYFLTEAMVFGRIAGVGAAAETPLSSG